MKWLLAAFLLERVQIALTGRQYANAYAGWGAINGTNARTIQAPMAYRVLVPWLIAGVERIDKRLPDYRLEVYEAIKVLSLWLALWSVSLAWGDGVALIVVALLPVTFWFDYWNWPFEMAGIALGMTGVLPLAVGGAFLHALSKETAPLAPVAYFAATSDLHMALILLAFVAVVMLIVRIFVGEREFYCDRWMIRRNWKEILQWRQARPKLVADTVITLGLSALIAGAVLQFDAGWYIPLALLVAGWALAVANETRIFAGALPWVALWLMSW